MSRSTSRKALIITEKPSVAKDVVAALGGFSAMNGGAYWESDDYLCTFAVGHIFTLLEPEEIDPAYKSWRIETLPIIPRPFRLKPVQGHEKRIAQISDLLGRKDVDSLINACDAAREGELIFREIVRYFDSKKWVRRLWLQSMTPEAIRQGFTKLRDGTDLDGLAAAAECRAQADWLIGMNATRAFSVRLRSGRESAPWSVGRVQTPTLALLVRRELQILEHKPRGYFRIKARFEAPDHEYDGIWFDPTFKKPADDATDLRDDRIFDEVKAKAILAAVRGHVGRASETREESQRFAPYLFNLTGLQKYMASRYKWSSRRTLDAAQRCYEQHKVLTYPRTSSSCLPSDYRPEVSRLIDGLARDPLYGPHAQYLLDNGLKNDKRVFDDKGVSDHFAIIPTGKTRALAGDDQKIFDAVVRRFLATFYPPAVYDRVKRVTEVNGHSFRTGPVETLMVPGWMAVYDRKAETEASADGEAPEPKEKLPPLKKGEKSAKNVPTMVLSTDLDKDETRPPARISEAQLLGLMEHAGRQVDNEELAAALMSAEGLGTAATRADIIQNLKHKQYIDETLRPTSKGIHLITILDRLAVARLTSAELTARLELELAEVEGGRRPQTRFMDEVAQYATDVVDKARTLDVHRLYADTDPLGPCPVCKQFLVYERSAHYSCQNHRTYGHGCTFLIVKELSGRYVDRVTAAELVAAGETRLLDGFVSTAGKAFKGKLALEADEVRIRPQFPHQDEPISRDEAEARQGAYQKRGDPRQGASGSRYPAARPSGAALESSPSRGSGASSPRNSRDPSASTSEARGSRAPDTLGSGASSLRNSRDPRPSIPESRGRRAPDPRGSGASSPRNSRDPSASAPEVRGSRDPDTLGSGASSLRNSREPGASTSEVQGSRGADSRPPGDHPKSKSAPRAARSPEKKVKPTPAPVAPALAKQRAAPLPTATPWLDADAAAFGASNPSDSPPVPDDDGGYGLIGDAPTRRPAVIRQQPITICPVHGRDCQIIETRAAYCCESRLKELKEGAPKPYGFMVPKLLCRRELKASEVKMLADKGFTAELQGFVSKTGRPFAARLILTPEGGFNFEFAKRQSFAERRYADRGADEDL